MNVEKMMMGMYKMIAQFTFVFLIFDHVKAIPSNERGESSTSSHSNRPQSISHGHGQSTMGYPIHRSESFRFSPEIPPNPQPNKELKERVWDAWKTESKRTKNTVRQHLASITVGGHAAISVAQAAGRHACLTATCADPGITHESENEVRQRFKLGKEATRATWKKASEDLRTSQDRRKIHVENYQHARRAGNGASQEFQNNYSYEKDQLEKYQVAKENRKFYRHASYLKQLVRKPNSFPPNPRIDYPAHNE